MSSRANRSELPISGATASEGAGSHPRGGLHAELAGSPAIRWHLGVASATLALAAVLLSGPPAVAQQSGSAGQPQPAQCFTATDHNTTIRACNVVLTAARGYTADQIGSALQRRGEALSALGRYDDAVVDFQEMIRRNNNPHRAHALIGGVRYLQGRYDASETSYRAAIAINPSYALAHNGLGSTRYAGGNLDGAIASFTEALRLDPRDLLALYQRAQAYQDKGDTTAALRDFDAAVSIATGIERVRALTYRGRLQNNAKNYERSIADCQEAMTLAERLNISDGKLRAAAAVCLGLARSNRGELQAAKEDYDRALQLDKDDHTSHAGRGYVALQRGRYDAAVADFETALRLSPTSQDALRYLGVAYAEKGDLAKALAALERAATADPKDPWPLMLRATTLAKAGDRERALRDADKAFTLAGDQTSDAHLARGAVYYFLDDLARARPDIDTAIRLNPRNAQAHMMLARLLLRLDRPDEAARSTETAASIIPSDPGLAMLRGLEALARKDYPRAVREITASLAINSAHAEGFAARGRAYEAQGRRELAIADYRTAADRLALDPDGRRAKTVARQRLVALLTPAAPPPQAVAATKPVAPPPASVRPPTSAEARPTATAGGASPPPIAPRPAPATSVRTAEARPQPTDAPDATVAYEGPGFFCRVFDGLFSHTRRYSGVEFDIGCRPAGDGLSANGQKP